MPKRVIRAFIIFIICGSLSGIFLTIIKASQSSGRELLQQKCFRCHDLKRVFYLRKSQQQWQVTVERMQNKIPKWIGAEDVKQISVFLTKNYGVDRKVLFKDLCVSCHQRIKKKELLYKKKTKNAWARAIERMRYKYHFLIGVDETEEIYWYCTNPRNNKNLKLEIDEHDKLEGIFENKCGRCHTFGFLTRHKMKETDWQRVLYRMQSKSPALINDQDLEEIRQYIHSSDKGLGH